MTKKMSECAVMNKECRQIFNFIKESILDIKKSQDKHLEGSERREEEIRTLMTDVAVIKTNVANHLQHHTETKQGFQWRTGLIVGIITFSVSLAVSLLIRYL